LLLIGRAAIVIPPDRKLPAAVIVTQLESSEKGAIVPILFGPIVATPLSVSNRGRVGESRCEERAERRPSGDWRKEKRAASSSATA